MSKYDREIKVLSAFRALMKEHIEEKSERLLVILGGQQYEAFQAGADMYDQALDILVKKMKRIEGKERRNKPS